MLLCLLSSFKSCRDQYANELPPGNEVNQSSDLLDIAMGPYILALTVSIAGLRVMRRGLFLLAGTK